MTAHYVRRETPVVVGYPVGEPEVTGYRSYTPGHAEQDIYEVAEGQEAHGFTDKADFERLYIRVGHLNGPVWLLPLITERALLLDRIDALISELDSGGLGHLPSEQVALLYPQLSAMQALANILGQRINLA